METQKNLGIWMDNHTAHLIDLTAKKNSHSIESKFTNEVKGSTLQKNENLMHNKEQHMTDLYYKEIADKILKYDNVLLFGPTNAKKELHNFLNKDSHFKDINIDIESADKMTDNEKETFVHNHFKSKI